MSGRLSIRNPKRFRLQRNRATLPLKAPNLQLGIFGLLESGDKRRPGLSRNLPQETVETEQTTTDARECRHEKKDRSGRAFFLREQTTGQSAAPEKTGTQTSPENHSQILSNCFWDDRRPGSVGGKAVRCGRGVKSLGPAPVSLFRSFRLFHDAWICDAILKQICVCAQSSTIVRRFPGFPVRGEFITARGRSIS